MLKQRAIQKMAANPGAALALTLAAAWRGAILLLPLFVWVTVYCLRKRRDDLLAFCLPAFAMTVFYALLSHFEPRYGSAMMPVALLGAAVLVHDSGLSARLWSRARAALHAERWVPKSRRRSEAGH